VIVKDGVQLSVPFLDIRDRVGCCGERGLLSAAFPPGYRGKRYFYVNYTDRAGDTKVARYRVTQDADRADPASEEIVLAVQQPYANHNGGQLAFGPDGYLYIGMGDGGSANDPHGNGQKMSTLLGKLLRIDVESGVRPYAVPPSNPFVGKKEVRPEIWASGLRNPWRFSFDRATGDLFIADVGQDRFEEVNVQPPSSKGGENYGWNVLEGSHCLRSKTCDTAGLVPPVAEYDHGQGCSVTGGMVYRGKALPHFQGNYVYGDYCSGRIWGMRKEDGRWNPAELADTKLSISTFGEDEAGEVYVADHSNGGIYRMEGR
jgi:glucose/arabinose dehydrogenase